MIQSWSRRSQERGPGILRAELGVGPGRCSVQPGGGAAPQHLPGARVSGGGARSRVSRFASREVSSLKVLRRGPGFRNRSEGENWPARRHGAEWGSAPGERSARSGRVAAQGTPCSGLHPTPASLLVTPAQGGT